MHKKRGLKEWVYVFENIHCGWVYQKLFVSLLMAASWEMCPRTGDTITKCGVHMFYKTCFFGFVLLTRDESLVFFMQICLSISHLDRSASFLLAL